MIFRLCFVKLILQNIQHILGNHLDSWGTMFVGLGFFAYSRGCIFVDASVFNLCRAGKSLEISFCLGCKLVGQGLSRIPWIFANADYNDFTVLLGIFLIQITGYNSDILFTNSYWEVFKFQRVFKGFKTRHRFCHQLPFQTPFQT